MSLPGFVRFFGNSTPKDSSPNLAHSRDANMYDARVPHAPPPEYTELTGHQAAANGAHQRNPQEVSVVAVMGPTGSGKSTFISKLASQSMRIGHSLSSCTKEPEEIPCKIGDKIVILVDTPGFNDTYRPDTDILASIVDWMKASYQEMQLSGIIYLHDIKLDRMYGSSLTNLRMFRKLCGDDNLANVILATTKWSDPPKSEELSREEQLKTDDEFWGLMIRDGSLVRRFDNTKPSARALVEEILNTGKDHITPQIQHEVVELGRNLSETEAGAFIDKRLIELAKRHQEEVEGLMEEQERARRKQDRKMQESLEKQRKLLEERIAERQEQQQILHLNEIDRLKKQVEDLRKKTANTVLNNNQKWYHSTWKCLICKTKTKVSGRWTCPQCQFVQITRTWEDTI